MANHINRVVLTGNLTKDPDLHTFDNGNAICTLRVASNTRKKNPDGTWGEKPNFFDVKVWGKQGENAARFLSKGRPVAIDGRLEWREWEKDGQKRQAVEIIAEAVQFLGGNNNGGNGGGGEYAGGDSAPAASGNGGDDDLPF